MTIKSLPKGERPYEKLIMYGAEKLSNAELLAIIIKTGTREKTSIELANMILAKSNKIEEKSLRFLADLTMDEFIEIKGIGRVKAIELKAVCELAKRMTIPIEKNIKIKSARDVADILIDELRFEKREKLKVLLLNTKNILQKIVDVSYGGTNSAVIDPKDVLIEAIKIGAPKIILVHNHPSGDPTPSREDYLVTKRIEEASEIVGIELIDHIVVGDGQYKSIFFERKL